MSKIIHLSKIDSTSLYIKNNRDSLDNFNFVYADYQTNGKGRNDRVWESNERENLLCSLLIKDKYLCSKYSSISLACASIIRDYLVSIGLNNVSIKWPNDVYVEGKKICGILLEGNINEYLVVGIGLNVNQMAFNNDLRHPATSIKLELGNIYDIDKIALDVHLLLMNHLSNLNNYDYLAKVRSNNYLLNKTALAEINGIKKEVKILDINDDNSLKVLVDNEIVNISSGEVTFHENIQ